MAHPKIAFTDNPWGKAAMGCSSGGAAALTMGWFRYPLGAWEYHSGMKLIESSARKPLRIFTHVSENDNRAKDPEETYATYFPHDA